MRVRGSYKPGPLEIEAIDDGKTALIRLYDNMKAYEDPETETEPAVSGYEFDRYTLTRPYTDKLKADLEANTVLWLNFARQQEREKLASEVRNRRDALLAASDWTQQIDAPVSAGSIEALRSYRQELREITKRPEFPYVTQWPDCPDIEAAMPDPIDNAVAALEEMTVDQEFRLILLELGV